MPARHDVRFRSADLHPVNFEHSSEISDSTFNALDTFKGVEYLVIHEDRD